MCGASGVALSRRASIAAVRPEGIRTLAFCGGNRNPTLYPPRFLLHLFLVFNGFGGQAELEVVSGGGYTALHCAAQEGKDAVATQLVNANANVNAVTAYGSTPLHKAAYNGHAIVADLLLTAGANPKATDKSGMTPAQVAEQNGQRELAERLRQAEASAASK